jgi:hypothetical protein
MNKRRLKGYAVKIEILLASAGLLTTPQLDPSPVAAPSFKTGDTWVYDQTEQRGTSGFDQRRLDLTIERADGDTMLVGIKRDGAPGGYEDHLIGADWSQRQVVNGEDAVTTRPYQFPMKVGQTWLADFTNATRHGLRLSAHVHWSYKVMGWEDVTVPAGTFHALRIAASGTEEAVEIVPTRASGGAAASPLGSSTYTNSQRGGTALVKIRTHSELYYVPSIKNAVKSIEERYSSDDILVDRSTRVLLSYRPGG